MNQETSNGEAGRLLPGAHGSATAIDLNRYEQARAERQRWTLAQSVEAQEERIAAHYTAFAHLAMQLRELTEARKHGCTTDLNDTIRYLTGKIREGHLMEFGIQLEWPNAEAKRPGGRALPTETKPL